MTSHSNLIGITEQRCTQCSRIPWNIQIWDLLARFRKSRDSEYHSRWYEDNAVDDLDFALDALRQECDHPSTSEHKDDANGVLGVGSLLQSQMERLRALIRDDCDGDQDERNSKRRRIDLWPDSDEDEEDEDEDEDESYQGQIKVIVNLQVKHKATTVYFNHHPTVAALDHAAAMGCYLCRSLQAGLRLGPLKRLIIESGYHHGRMRQEPSDHGPPSVGIHVGQFINWTLQLRSSPVPGETVDEEGWFSFPQSLRRETLDHDLECLVHEVIRPWVDDCDAGKGLHQRCRPIASMNPGQLPTRLIDVGTCPTDTVRLVVASEDIPKTGEQPKYLTLSYCWGWSNAPAKTTSQNFHERRRNIDTENLPQTIQDAIRLTKVMKIRYLWVDALCIIQNLEDFYLEAVKMSSYYANGYCLISATGFSDSSEGLFPDRKIGNYRTKTCTFGYDDQHETYWLLRNPAIGLEFETSLHIPVMERAWCLQERLLSPRILHITPEAVFWRCQSIPEMSEFYQNPEPQPSKEEIKRNMALIERQWFHPSGMNEQLPLTEELQEFMDKPLGNYVPILVSSDYEGIDYDGILNQPSMAGMWLDWTNLVRKYVDMELSYEDDRLTAIQGLGHKLAERHGDRYFGGIFLSHLAHGLLWHGDKRPLGRRSTRCPTWSWGVAKEVRFIDLERSIVSNIGNGPVFPSSTGMVEMMGNQMRRLHLSVPMVPMANIPLDGSPTLKTSVTWAYRGLAFTLQFDEERLVPCDLRHVKVMLLGYTKGYKSLAGLVVRNSMGNDQYLERIGHAEVRVVNSDMRETNLDSLFKVWTESVNLI